MVAVCQSVQIEMYVCNLSKDFSLSMILVMSDTLYMIHTDSEWAREREYRWKSGKRTQNSSIWRAHGVPRSYISKGSKN